MIMSRALFASCSVGVLRRYAIAVGESRGGLGVAGRRLAGRRRLHIDRDGEVLRRALGGCGAFSLRAMGANVKPRLTASTFFRKPGS